MSASFCFQEAILYFLWEWELQFETGNQSNQCTEVIWWITLNGCEMVWIGRCRRTVNTNIHVGSTLFQFKTMSCLQIHLIKSRGCDLTGLESVKCWRCCLKTDFNITAGGYFSDLGRALYKLLCAISSKSYWSEDTLLQRNIPTKFGEKPSMCFWIILSAHITHRQGWRQYLAPGCIGAQCNKDESHLV